MSYDICLVIDTGGSEPASLIEDRNMTYNVSPMFRKALKEGGVNKLDGKLAKDCINMLRDGIKDMQDKKAEYEKLNPSNGWGDYDSALNYLKRLLDDALAHPKATFKVD